MANEIKIIHGKCEEVLKTFQDNYFDSVVTDAPYGLRFMGKKWDYDVPTVAQWQEIIRVLKPGGHLLCACGTRTQHRMAVNIEDAGFEIRDVITWHYGSGFPPKSLDISKAIDKRGGEAVGWFGEWLRNWREENNVLQKDIAKLFPSATGGLTGCVANWELGLNMPTVEQFNIICKAFNLPFKDMREAEREIIGTAKTNLTVYQNIGGRNESGSINITAPSTDAAKQWEGWGSNLKPATEFWTLCRKPLSENTVAENVLKWGTGGINIDGCRIESGEEITNRVSICGNTTGKDGFLSSVKESIYEGNSQGRFPANLILDEFAAAELDKQSGIVDGRTYREANARERKIFKNDNQGSLIFGTSNSPDSYGDTGGASLFLLLQAFTI